MSQEKDNEEELIVEVEDPSLGSTNVAYITFQLKIFNKTLFL